MALGIGVERGGYYPVLGVSISGCKGMGPWEQIRAQPRGIFWNQMTQGGWRETDGGGTRGGGRNGRWVLFSLNGDGTEQEHPFHGVHFWCEGVRE